MIWIGLAVAYALPFLSGLTFVLWVLKGKNSLDIAESFVIALAVGFGLISMETFVLSLAGIPLTFFSLSLVQSVVLVFFAALVLRSKPTLSVLFLAPDKTESAKGNIRLAVSIILTLIIIFKAVFIIYEGLNRPIYSHDAWWHLSSGAKFFFYERSLVLDPASEYFLGRGYRAFLGYPLNNTLIQLWISLAVGSFDEILAKSWSALFFISIVTLIYRAVRKEGGPFKALVAAFFISVVPLLTYHAMDAYSDIILSFYVLAGALLLWRYFEGGANVLVILSGLLFSMAFFTKSEGVVYYFSATLALILFVIFDRRREIVSILYFLLPGLIYLSPWLLFNAYYGIGFGHGTGQANAGSSSGILFESSLHFEVIPAFFTELFFSINHGLIFLFLLIFTAVGIKTVFKTRLVYLYIMLLSSIIGFLIIYMATSDFIYALNGVSINRNILTFVPLSYLIGSILAVRLLQREGG